MDRGCFLHRFAMTSRSLNTVAVSEAAKNSAPQRINRRVAIFLMASKGKKDRGLSRGSGRCTWPSRKSCSPSLSPLTSALIGLVLCDTVSAIKVSVQEWMEVGEQK